MDTDAYLKNFKKLAAIGLNPNQIHAILQRLPEESVDLFIHKWNNEKKQHTTQQQYTNTQFSHTIERGIYESRKGDTGLYNFENRQQLPTNTPHVPYMPRILPNVSPKISSEEMNNMYQQKTQSRTNPSANLDIMAAQLFGNPPGGYTQEYLHKKYRQLAVSMHPDKHGGDNQPFHMLTTCYNHLKNNTPHIHTKHTQKEKQNQFLYLRQIVFLNQNLTLKNLTNITIIIPSKIIHPDMATG